MSDLDTRLRATASTTSAPRRTTLVALASVYLVGFVIMMSTGSDREPAADPARIIATYDTTLGQARLQAFGMMALCGLLVLLGAGLRSALDRTEKRWTADAVLAGFSLLAVGYAGFGMSAMVLRHAVEIGDTDVVAMANLLDTTNFLPVMPAMVALYLGVGLTGLRTRAVPTWLAWASVVLGVLAPAGPCGFAPFMLLPVWSIAVAATVRLDRPDEPTAT